MDVKDFRMIYDHHTHTTYSHGKGSIEDNVRVAYEKGLKSIAITDHGPGNFSYGIKMSRIPDMRRDIEAAIKKYPGVEVLLGVEANTLMRKPYIDISEEQYEDFDIVLAGYHFAVLNGNMVGNWVYAHDKRAKMAVDKAIESNGSSLLVKNTAMIVNALYHNEEIGHHIEILTHPGDKGPFDIDDIACACEETGTLLEINMKHPYLSVEGLKIASKYDVNFVISSDAHVPENVGVFEPQLKRALEAGIDPERIVNIEKI